MAAESASGWCAYTTSSGRGFSIVQVVGIIPARLASTRLPDKPLLLLAGKPLIQHVWERSLTAGMDRLVVATPDAEIAETAARFGAEAVLTSDRHRSGTDRVAEAAVRLCLPDGAIVLNIQGDEPLVDASDLQAVIRLLVVEEELVMASARCVCPGVDLDNPACVKVVCDLDGYALYFSRSRVPFPRSDAGAAHVWQHVGIYAYRAAFLQVFARLEPTPLECRESLEQLRALEHGYRIRLADVAGTAVGVDTPDDFERARKLLE